MADPETFERDHPHVFALIQVVLGLAVIAFCVWQMQKNWLFPKWRIGGADGLSANQLVFGFLAICAGFSVLVHFVRLVMPTPDRTLPRTACRGHIVGMTMMMLDPPDWGPGVFFASKKSVDFVTDARVRHSLGQWHEAFSHYSASPDDRTITLWLTNAWGSIDLEPGDAYEQWLGILEEHHVVEGPNPYAGVDDDEDDE